MGLIEHETFVCIDCETTGLDPMSDRLIEVAVVTFTFTELLERFESLVDPKCSIPENTIAIHHITEEMVAGQPEPKDILPQVLQLIGNHTIIGHGIQFDINFISEECKRAKVPCKITGNPFFDTLRMARLYGESPVNSLERLREHFNIAEEGAHRAMSDVIVNIEVFKYLCDGFKTTQSLHKRLEKPILLRAMPLGKYKQRPFAEIPIEYLRWAAHKDFDRDLLYSIRSEIKKRKKEKPFQQASSPFSNL